MDISKKWFLVMREGCTYTFSSLTVQGVAVIIVSPAGPSNAWRMLEEATK